MDTSIEVMTKIEEKWKLPVSFLEYLRTHPKSQYIESEDEDSFDEIVIHLYGANDLIKGQEGYSYNPVEKTVIEDWNPNYIVVANSEADPFCIDISVKNSPIYYAMHGMGEWEFEEYCDSFESFLNVLGIL